MSTQPSNLFDVATFRSLYQSFDKETLERLPHFYSDDIFFKDPIHQLNGIEALTRYFASFCDPELACNFVFSNQLITEEQAFFQWDMHYRHPRLKNGEPLTLKGGTLIKFNSHIYYHEDLYDMGAMIYQHIPILGWAINKVNARLVSDI